MVKKNVEYFGVKNLTTANFGQGTIKLTVGFEDKKQPVPMLIITSGEKSPVGSKEPHGCEFADELKPEIIFEFSNTESVDVLIEELQTIKEIFNKKEQ